MAELMTYREAVSEGIAREMRRDPDVVFLARTSVPPRASSRRRGPLRRFGPGRVWDTPISEQAIVGAAWVPP